ncbi:MAG: hypothetical protein LUH00_04145 [Lachnospiraceae bacterium]|nr:hypothetical protein [Lachnospiraceae bacterium]
MSEYQATAISGVGVMQKVKMIPFQITQGISSGVLPLIAYHYAGKNLKRMQDVVFQGILLNRQQQVCTGGNAQRSVPVTGKPGS